MKKIDDITGAIVDTALKIHIELGPGLLESVYEKILSVMLEKQGFHVEVQKNIGFEYGGICFNDGLRMDILVEDCVIVELKSVEKMSPVYSKQLLTYLRLSKCPVGLLINFGAPTLKEGLQRIVDKYTPHVSSPLRINR